MDTNRNLAIRDLYPHSTAQELVAAEAHLDRYLALVLRIFERIEAEADPQADPLTRIFGTLGSKSPAEESA